MKANPGGQLDPSDIVGREELIDRLWRVLRRQSLVLVAVRRMGKTCIVKKMAAEPPEVCLVVYHDLEDVHTVGQLAEMVFDDVLGFFGCVRRGGKRLGRLALASEGGRRQGR